SSMRRIWPAARRATTRFQLRAQPDWKEPGCALDSSVGACPSSENRCPLCRDMRWLEPRRGRSGNPSEYRRGEQAVAGEIARRLRARDTDRRPAGGEEIGQWLAVAAQDPRLGVDRKPALRMKQR